MSERRLVSLDWAIKRILRSKANFEVLEGLISELLMQDVKIKAILESESNQETSTDKYNRVDIKVQNQKKEIIIVEIQYNEEHDFFHRILYATSKTITEHMEMGKKYSNVVKVVSINILYFDLGKGKDYIYRGTTNFIGMHTNESLKLSTDQQKVFKKESPADIYPEYYLININKFNDVAKTPLDEWIYFLKNETIEDSFTAKGLKKAKEVLDIMNLSPAERRDYENFLDNQRSKRSSYDTATYKGIQKGIKIGVEKGKVEGIEIGMEKGEDKKNREFVLRLFNKKYDTATISDLTGLSLEKVQAIINSVTN